MEFTKKTIFEEFHFKKYRIITEEKALKQALEFIEDKIERKLNIEGRKIVQNKIQYLFEIYLKEIKAQRHDFSKIERKFRNDWYTPCIIIIDEWLIKPDLIEASQASTSKKGPGRPSKDFVDVAKSTEYAGATNASKLVNNNIKILLLAVKNATKVEQKDFTTFDLMHLSFIINTIISNLHNLKKINIVVEKDEKKPELLSQKEALGFLLENNLSKQVYKNIRMKCKEKNALIFPSYKHILDAKKECRPAVINYEDTKASTTFKALFEHTAARLVENETDHIKCILQDHEDSDVEMSNDEVMSVENSGKLIEATLIFADGGDGTTGFSHFNQKSESGQIINDHSLFTWSATPIALITKEGIELWRNPSPNSPFSNRPIMLEFAKETNNYVKDVYEKFEKEKQELSTLTLPLGNANVKITPEFHTTLIDGKVFNVITKTSSQSCPVCEAKPKDFLNREICVSKNKGLIHGLQPLHAIINVFNFLLHIAYKMDNKTWQARTTMQKKNVDDRKIEIQQRLRDEFGITFDAPRAGGFGNTTTGNLCRRVFAEPERLAAALCLDVEMVINFSTILGVLNCKEEIDTEKLDELCKNTIKFFEDGGSCNWAKISPTVHKILFHSKEIIMMLPLSPGYFSEEGSEAKNKYLKQYRLSNARKSSVKASLADTFNRNMDASDPIIFLSSVIARKQKRKQRPLPERVLQYIKNKDFDDIIDKEFCAEVTYADNFDNELDDCILDIEFENLL
ncbi:hypothetical protein PVAND_017658 [Polypedilum vanderplanki]|uniref:V(D)J recombination-activating protein 1 RNase H domain-containing protein n=1 Tax=Polypedilum vanderplanki TaxID=319348 RepID=A0A9J6B8T7_POLVA|nr:hypothetical protein PVAND_017658 [Polypedilum vanderplanki]